LYVGVCQDLLQDDVGSDLNIVKYVRAKEGLLSRRR
jgi:hypothetical protein